MFEHFISAQAQTFEEALAELADGKKRSHWMWFVFPQIVGLGRSEMSQRFALADVREAAQYLSHPILGPRLRSATKAALAHRGQLTARDILGTPDDLKFQSCMTLFARAAPEDPLFSRALDAFYGGREDIETVRRL